MGWVHIIVLFCGGVLAASGFIIAKKPEARDLIAKLVPAQAGIGVAMLVLGIINLINGVFTGGLRAISLLPLLGLATVSMVVCEILVGFLLGFGLVAQWMPGEGNAEKKGVEMQQKLVKFQSPLGLVAIVTSLIMLLYALGILKPF